MQMEAPPYQFEYERNWFSEHDSGINHICWIVPSAYDTVEHLQSNGATVAMPYEEFGDTYHGFVAIDPEGPWVEIMSYVGDFKTPDVEFRPIGHPGLQTLGVVQLCRDLNSQVEWYTEVLGLKIIPRLSFQRPWSRGLIRTPVGAPRLAQPAPPVGAAVGVPAADWAIIHGYSVWTVAAGRRVLDRFIGGGGRYARLAGNIVWQVRLEDDMATQVCHKYAAHADPERHSDDTDRRTGAFEAHYIDWPPATTYGANGLRGVYSRMGGLSPRGPGGFIVYRPEHWAFAGADVYYGDILGAEVPLVGYETDGVDYTFRQGLPYPTGADGSPDGLEILALTPVTLEEEDHGQAGNLISIADGDLSFAAEAIYGEDTPENRNRLRYGSAVITAMTKGEGEVFCAGTTEWCHALTQGDRQVETITANILDRFLGN